MLEKPDISEEKISSCIQEAYGLVTRELQFLPLGADINAASYRLLTQDGEDYFVKLKRGAFSEIGVTLPYTLHLQEIPQVIPPLPTATGQLWTQLADFQVILYPYIQGRSGFEVILSAAQWADFGAALKRVHTIQLPPSLLRRIPAESYTPHFRKAVKRFLERAPVETFTDPVAAKVAGLLVDKEAVIRNLIQRAEDLADQLKVQQDEFVLCHADAHAGNILVDDEGALYIVDWDAPILAAKERDLMFIGGAQGFRGVTPQEEEMLFYQGYGETPINPTALAYYRYERIIQDIAAFCEQLLDSEAGGNDREQSYHYLLSNFMPGNTIEVTKNSDESDLTS